MKSSAAVAASSEPCAIAAEEILREGGNVVDAVVAAVFATGAGDAAVTSLAGGGILIRHDGASGRTDICDFFAAAPGLEGRLLAQRSGGARTGAARPPLDFHEVELDFREGGARQTFHVGRAAAAVPGVLPGLCATLERWGSLPLARLVAPAVRLLRDGVPLGAYQLACHRVLAPILRASALGREIFFTPSEELLPRGATFSNRELADCLEQLGRDGLEPWWSQVITPRLLAQFGEDAGGRLTAADLAEYRPIFRTAISSPYRGVRVATNPPPSLGGRFVLQTLALFERAGVGELAFPSPERLRRTTAVFAAIADLRSERPEVLDEPSPERRFAERLDHVLASGGEGRPEPRVTGNTTHISVIDGAGNAAGASVSHGEGNGHALDGTGILMNNLLGEADLFPGGFHRFTPGERLRTMMAPTVLTAPDGDITVLGSGGSNRIRTALPQVIARLVDDGVTSGDAVASSRIHVEGGVLSAETYQGDRDLEGLVGAGRFVETVRRFDRPSLFFGGVNIARRRADRRLESAADPRRGGATRTVERSPT